MWETMIYTECRRAAPPHLGNKKETLSVCVPPSQHVTDEQLYYNHLDSQ